MEVQYQLFKNIWRQRLQPKSGPINIYTFYDNVDMELLMGYQFDRKVSDILFSFSNVGPSPRYRFHPTFSIVQDPLGATSSSVGEYWIVMGTQSRLRTARSYPQYIEQTFNHFLKRLLEEPDSLEEYNIEVAESHVLVVCRCLWFIHKLHLQSDRE